MTQPLSLEEFRRNPEAVRDQLHASGEPQVLTVDGKPDLVIQDAAKYEAMLDELEEQRFVKSVLTASQRMREGVGGYSPEEVEAHVRAKHGL